MTKRVVVFVLSFVFGAALAVFAQDSGPLQTYLVRPCRLIDTRLEPQTKWDSGRVLSGYERFYRVQGNCGIPYWAVAALMNITAVNASGEGHLNAYDPATTSAPDVWKTSIVNFRKGQSVANSAVVRLSAGITNDQYVDVGFYAFVESSGTIDLVVDVVGYLR